MVITMKIKNYMCKCGCDDFFFIEKDTHIGIYCIKCGKWFKWASHDERNLMKLKKGDGNGV